MFEENSFTDYSSMALIVLTSRIIIGVILQVLKQNRNSDNHR